MSPLVYYLSLLFVTTYCVVSESSPAVQISLRHNGTVTPTSPYSSWKTWDGIGGISGGGATSRLLQDYPMEVSTEILDFLFRPNFGAAAQVLKVEMGGDTYSTGSEASHMHSKEDLDLTRGYEWWLLKEAKRRNPRLKTYVLPWGFPAWVSEGNVHDPFAKPLLVVNYTLQWILGAKQVHGIDIDYVGIWNERDLPSAVNYVKLLRKQMDLAGLKHTVIVSNDLYPPICKVMQKDKAYRDAVGVIGLHYPNDADEALKMCGSLGKPVWSSEESSSYADLNGAACWARVIASHYVLNNITANLMWNLVGSLLHGTDWYSSSMLTAVQPWSGYYESEEMPVVWATAHYTQFTEIGWKYHHSQSGELKYGGYYTTMVDVKSKNVTTVIVKISKDHASCTRPKLWNYATKAETVKVFLGQLEKVFIRHSNFESDPPVLFELVEAEVGSDRTLTLSVGIGDVYTVSSVGPGGKGTPKTQEDQQRSSAPFPLPYRDDFRSYQCTGCYAKYLADQMGAFEIHSGFKGDGPVLRQMTPAYPVVWIPYVQGPLTVLGNYEWEDIRVTVSFRIPPNQPARAAACIGTRANRFWTKGVFLCAGTSSWVLRYGGPGLKNPLIAKDKYILASGRVQVDAGKWYNLSLATCLDTVHSAKLSGVELVAPKKIPLRRRDNGFVAIGVSGYFPIEFAHVEVDKVGDRWKLAESTIDYSSATLGARECSANGLADASQRFELRPNWQIRHLPSKLCVDATNATVLSLQPCKPNYAFQEFRNDYTTIRNKLTSLNNVHGVLSAKLNGSAQVGQPSGIGKWVYFPNTQQLRASLDYSGDVGAAQCLSVLPEAEVQVDIAEEYS